MKRQAYYVRHFICPVCGFRRPATKRSGSRTSVGHIKDMLCPRCNEIRKFEQVE